MEWQGWAPLVQMRWLGCTHVTGAFFGVFVLCQQKFTFKKEEVTFGVSEKVKVLVTQSCLTLCHPIDYSLPGSSVHGILQARMLDHFLLQGMFSTQGSNPGLIHCRQLPSESPGKPLGVSISPQIKSVVNEMLTFKKFVFYYTPLLTTHTHTHICGWSH